MKFDAFFNDKKIYRAYIKYEQTDPSCRVAYILQKNLKLAKKHRGYTFPLSLLKI